MSKCVLNEKAEFGYDCECDVISGFVQKSDDSSKSPGYANTGGCEWDGKTTLAVQSVKPKPAGLTATVKPTEATTTVAPTTATADDGQIIWPSLPNVDSNYKNNPVTFGLGWAASPPKPDTQLYGIEGIFKT